MNKLLFRICQSFKGKHSVKVWCYVVPSCLFIFFFMCSVPVAQACRLYLAMGDKLSDREIVSDLLLDDQSFYFLGKTYPDGWSLAYFKDDVKDVLRGEISASLDKAFEDAVVDAANIEPQLVLSHLRKSSSGCRSGVPNPHPFKQRLADKELLFFHNGWIPKKLLIKLIGDETLQRFPPQSCTYDPPESWVDSELFFIYLLKHIELEQNHIFLGLRNALRVLYQSLPKGRRHLNFLLTNGEQVWAFRKGNMLYYQFDPKKRLTKVASTIPEGTQGDWKEFPEDQVGFIHQGQDIRFLHIMSDLTY